MSFCHHTGLPSADDIAARSVGEIGRPVALPGATNDRESVLWQVSSCHSPVKSDPLHEDGRGARKAHVNIHASTIDFTPLTGPPGGVLLLPFIGIGSEI
jgi:hypothetical protein